MSVRSVKALNAYQAAQVALREIQMRAVGLSGLDRGKLLGGITEARLNARRAHLKWLGAILTVGEKELIRSLAREGRHVGEIRRALGRQEFTRTMVIATSELPEIKTNIFNGGGVETDYGHVFDAEMSCKFCRLQYETQIGFVAWLDAQGVCKRTLLKQWARLRVGAPCPVGEGE